CLLQRRHRGGACGQDHVRRERNQFRRIFAQPIGIAQAPPILDAHVSAVGPASFLQALYEGITAGQPFRIVRSQDAHEYTYAPRSLALLRPRCERPRGCAAEGSQQFPSSDGDCHTPLPCEVRKWNDTTPRARCPMTARPPAWVCCPERFRPYIVGASAASLLNSSGV